LVVASAILAWPLFRRARRRIQAAVDRGCNRPEYNEAKTIETFSARLRDQVDLDTLSVELLAVVGKRWSQRGRPYGSDRLQRLRRTIEPEEATSPAREVGPLEW
jgi:hypothetical protein